MAYMPVTQHLDWYLAQTFLDFLITIKILSLYRTKACCMVGAVLRLYSITHRARIKKKLGSLIQEIIKAEFS